MMREKKGKHARRREWDVEGIFCNSVAKGLREGTVRGLANCGRLDCSEEIPK